MVEGREDRGSGSPGCVNRCNLYLPQVPPGRGFGPGPESRSRERDRTGPGEESVVSVSAPF